MAQALFVGSKSIGLNALRTLMKTLPGGVAGAVTFDDSADGRSVLSEFRNYCESVDLPLSVIRKPSELPGKVLLHAPQFVLVVGWYWILNADLLKAVPGGFVGVHASLLPQYRGNAPLVWAILNGETQTGVTLFYFDEGMDTGDIVEQQAFAIESEETIAEVLVKAESATMDLVSRHAASLLSNTASRHIQDHTQTSYASLRRPEDGRIDWHLPAAHIYNFIRAQARPYPGAFTYLPDSRMLRIWRASLFSYPYYGIPGLVGQTHESGVVVTCGEGAIVVYDCEIEGTTAVPVASVLKWGVKLG